jgi:hypothetical protein
VRASVLSMRSGRSFAWPGYGFRRTRDRSVGAR